MKLRYLMAGIVTAGGLSASVIARSGTCSKEPVPPSLAEAALWTPEAMPMPAPPEAPVLAPTLARSDVAPMASPPALPSVVAVAPSLPRVEPSLRTWAREIAAGETLDAVLAEAGLDIPVRAEVALALAAEFDLRRLRPGHVLRVITTPKGSPRRVVLEVDDGVRIVAIFGAQVATRVVAPDPKAVILAGEARIERSVFAALDAGDIPARFAVDLAQMLGGAVDFRRDITGGETLRMMWREERVGDNMVGQPDPIFAALDLGDTLFEIVWPEDGSGRATIYRDGVVMRVFAQPVKGARLSSVFGRRSHPVYGDVRMHTGVDFAAARGTPVYATAPGRASFVGSRGGYGRVVEIAHGSDTTTLYAHLSAVPNGLSQGDRVAAGDLIGRVGATGTATGPNLHYEVRVNGRPTDPLSDDRLAEAADQAADDAAALDSLNNARARLEERLVRALAPDSTERL
ncbi:M23 family metallopeptidase [Cereibacter changlensis]|uniref:M23 family metallopeptidase n=1 Tax=Cereibacter changlensis TaxID=402884 RepID=A0A4U0Z9Z1_9RHOB|nr:M23 family metallopeptidase [Cereibacter changlensis]TKA98413.1 M23 family metallopeptidase [Cereibacter changlensis]